MMVYFIQDSESGAVKIGISENPIRRLSDLQTAHHAKLLLIGIMDGERSKEQGLHRQFQQKHGEWFAPTDELMSFIASNAMSLSSMSPPTNTIVSYQPAITVPRPIYRSTPAERIDHFGMTILYLLLWLTLGFFCFVALVYVIEWVSGTPLPMPVFITSLSWWGRLALFADIGFLWVFIQKTRRWFRDHRLS